MISFLVFLIFVCIVVYAVCLAVSFVAPKIGIPEPILRLIYLLIAVVALYAVVHRYGGAVGVNI